MKITRLLTILTLACAGFWAQQARALTCYLLTDTNHLLIFDSATPGSVTDKTINNITAGYELVGLDMRTTVQPGSSTPGVGSLWALAISGTNARIFVINPSSGDATQIGGVLAGIDGSGSGPNAWFFGFNPATDLIQMTNFQKNYQLNPNTITYVTETPFSTFPNSNGSAYTSAPFGGTSSAYFVDQTPNDTLYTSANLSSGAASIVGDTGVNFSVGAGLDIADSVTLLAAKVGTAQLYSVNRSTGAASGGTAIGGNPNIRALTILPASFPTSVVSSTVTVKIKGKKKITTTKAKLKIRGTAASEAGIASVQYKIGKAKPKKAKGTTSWNFTAKLKPGTNKIQVKAIGVNGVVSSPVRLKVVRKK